ncbi:hypothetical protein GNF80_04925 [Clostridium perfringens]|nr:hypothetical protein [Clostridium perfringens]
MINCLVEENKLPEVKDLEEINIKVLIDELNKKLNDKCNEYLNTIKASSDWNEFEIDSINELLSNNISKAPGIYFFEINFKETLSDFTNKEKLVNFINDEFSENSEGCCPKINKERAKKHNIKEFTSNNWISFYIGKSGNLEERLEQHLLGYGHEKTYKLNLKNNKSSIFKKCKFRFKFIEETELKEKEYYWVIVKIEEHLRESLNPICGKQ